MLSFHEYLLLYLPLYLLSFSLLLPLALATLSFLLLLFLRGPVVFYAVCLWYWCINLSPSFWGRPDEGYLVFHFSRFLQDFCCYPSWISKFLENSAVIILILRAGYLIYLPNCDDRDWQEPGAFLCFEWVTQKKVRSNFSLKSCERESCYSRLMKEREKEWIHRPSILVNRNATVSRASFARSSRSRSVSFNWKSFISVMSEDIPMNIFNKDN